MAARSGMPAPKTIAWISGISLLTVAAAYRISQVRTRVFAAS